MKSLEYASFIGEEMLESISGICIRCHIFSRNSTKPANIRLFKVNIDTRCEICSKLTTKTPKRRH